MGLVGLITGRSNAQASIKAEQTSTSFIPISVEAMAQHQRIHSAKTDYDPRFFSDDSEQGTERASSSLRSNSLSPMKEHTDRQLGATSRPDDSIEDPESEELLERQGGDFRHNHHTWMRHLTRKFSAIVSRRARRIGELVYDIIDRLLLPLGFVTFSTGVVTYGGIFVSGLSSWP